jgi:hypothetical protein
MKRRTKCITLGLSCPLMMTRQNARISVYKNITNKFRIDISGRKGGRRRYSITDIVRYLNLDPYNLSHKRKSFIP